MGSGAPRTERLTCRGYRDLSTLRRVNPSQLRSATKRNQPRSELLAFSRPAPPFAAALRCHGIAMSEREFDNELHAPEDSLADSGTPAWRDEVAARMQQYRSRRKSKGPKYPSLQLPFERPELSRSVGSEPASRSSLALDLVVESAVDQRIDTRATNPVEAARQALSPAELPDQPLFFQDLRSEAAPSVERPRPEVIAGGTNLIEFPRYSAPPVDWDELAEPVVERPRILEVPELAPPQPALGGILLEPGAEPEAKVDPAAQLRPASIQRRLLATALDAIFVSMVTGLGAWIFLQMAHEVPPRPQLLIASVLIAATSWLGYQYLLLVLAGATLGQSLCKLELVAFDGCVPTMARRRWRGLSSLLSAASVMLGYAWALLDENGLCWHDRISQTYLRRKS